MKTSLSQEFWSFGLGTTMLGDNHCVEGTSPSKGRKGRSLSNLWIAQTGTSWSTCWFDMLFDLVLGFCTCSENQRNEHVCMILYNEERAVQSNTLWFPVTIINARSSPNMFRHLVKQLLNTNAFVSYDSVFLFRLLAFDRWRFDFYSFLLYRYVQLTNM